MEEQLSIQASLNVMCTHSRRTAAPLAVHCRLGMQVLRPETGRCFCSRASDRGVWLWDLAECVSTTV